MTLQELVTTLQTIRPGAEWTLVGDKFSDITWLDKVQSIPSQTEVDSAWAVLDVQEKRRKEYPPTTDLNDALVHQAAGDGGAALAVYFAKCEAIKAKYPKPS